MRYFFNILKLIAMSGLLPVSLAQALPASERVNLREACRQAASGEYMAAYDSVLVTTGSLSQTVTMEAQVAQSLKEAEAALKNIERQVENVSYDADLTNKLLHQREVVKSLTTTEHLYLEQITTSKIKLSEASKKEKYLRTALAKVFEIKRGRGTNKDYPTALTYKAECPKFRFMCALPEKYHDDLEAIELRPDTVDVCRRYVSFSKTGSRQ